MGSGWTTLYTAPAGKFAIVKTAVYRNFGSGTRLVTVSWDDASGSWFDGLDILVGSGGAAGGGGALYLYLVVPPGGSVRAIGGGSTTQFTLFGVEMPDS